VKECQEQACQQWLSFVHIGNTDHAKCRTSVSGLSSQHALGQDQHMKKLVDATSVLSNHHFDAVCAEWEKKCKVNWDKQKNEHEGLMQDQKIELWEASFTQFEGKCWCCGKKGHHSLKCPQCRSAPKANWATGKTEEMQHAQHMIDSTSSECANDGHTAATSIIHKCQHNTSN